MICTMNQYVEHIRRGSLAARELADWALSHGLTSLTTEDVSHLLGVPAAFSRRRVACGCLWLPSTVRGELPTPCSTSKT